MHATGEVTVIETERARIALTRPDHYAVNYSINPWMQPDEYRADPQRVRHAAAVASDALAGALERAGAEVVWLDGEPGLPDMVFPANAAVVLDGRALLGRFRHPERQPEEAAFGAAFDRLREQGHIREWSRQPEGTFQEGAGDCMWDASRGIFWAGHGPRSSLGAARHVAEFFGREVVPLELAGERCYHLDVGFVPLARGDVLYIPEAFTPEALRALHARVPPSLRLVGNAEDLASFCLNAIVLGSTIVSSRMPSPMRARLEARGYHVEQVDLWPFMMAGGAAFCMSLRLDLKAGSR
jgi:N-dimethylarginine dimethylaminohydrolase